ncbi:MAG: multidrug efflux pump subunit AcrA (membrane-fusion protein) [Vicingaceae bacterium]|jgi:multidrug efflux pump subunit AcrA (membrane-fusion protein)
MKKRQIIIVVVAVAIFAGGIVVKNILAAPKERPAKQIKENITTVFTTKVQNDSIPVYVESTGSVEAVKRIELFSEVQGVMEADNGRFRAGNSFNSGEVLIRIRSNDQQAQLYSQRSSFQSMLMSIMPDLKADYNDEFLAWNAYMQNFSVEKSTQSLPKVESDKLKSFLVGRGVYSSYHSLRNLEIINGKYNLTAPYNGVLIAANVDPGTLIRPGQALGTFIQPLNYELETSTDVLTAERLTVGQTVALNLQGMHGKQWKGKISRLVKAIDKNSQMSTFFVSVQGSDLKEGMFLQAKVKANEIPNAFEISRASLIDNKQVFVVEKGVLILKEVSTEYFNQSTAVITGLMDGDVVLTKVPPAAFEGMKVTVYKGEQ